MGEGRGVRGVGDIERGEIRVMRKEGRCKERNKDGSEIREIIENRKD